MRLFRRSAWRDSSTSINSARWSLPWFAAPAARYAFRGCGHCQRSRLEKRQVTGCRGIPLGGISIRPHLHDLEPNHLSSFRQTIGQGFCGCTPSLVPSKIRLNHAMPWAAGGYIMRRFAQHRPCATLRHLAHHITAGGMTVVNTPVPRKSTDPRSRDCQRGALL